MLNDIRIKDKNKTEKIVVRFSKDEKRIIKKYCQEKNIDMSKYIYNLVVVDITMFHNKLTEED